MQKLDLAGAFQLESEGNLKGVFQMSEEDYRGAPGMNQSLLKAMKKCPAAYKQALEWNTIQSKKKKHLEIGTLIHILLLEGHEAFESKIAKMPDLHPNTTVYRKAKADAYDRGQVVVSDSDLDMIHGIWKSALNDPLIQSCLKDGISEVAGFGRHRSGILMKGKVDYLKRDTIIDLKTTTSAEDNEFSKSAVKWRYDLQAAYYVDLVNLALGTDRYKEFIIIAVEKTPPYLFNYFFIAEQDMNYAREQYEQMMMQFLSCEKDDIWPGYEPKFKAINFGGWRK